MSSLRQVLIGARSAPTNPADLFALAFDAAPTAIFLKPPYVQSLVANENFIDLANRVCEAVRSGDGLAEILEEPASADETRDHLAFLVGVDEAFGAIHPHARVSSVRSLGLAECVVQYTHFGRYSVLSDGAVLPRFARPGRESVAPEDLTALLQNLIRVPAALFDTRLESPGTAPILNVQRRLPIVLDKVDFADGFSVACAPVIERPEEMLCTVVDRQGYLTYSIEPRDPTLIAGRYAETLQQLDQSGAVIGVLPELTLTPELTGVWSELLSKTPRPPGSRLRILLIGTGHFGKVNGDAPWNRAQLLDRLSGKLLGSQDKMYGYSTTGATLAEWGYPEMHDHGRLDEEMTRGSQLEFLETDLGRIVILICEDLAREIQAGHRLKAFGPSLILAPVLDTELIKFRWEHQKGRDYADHVGAAIVVANSLATRMDPLRESMGPRPTCLGAIPGHFALGAAARGPEVVRLHFGPDEVAVSGGSPVC